MWVRKRIDISWRDLGAGLLGCLPIARSVNDDEVLNAFGVDNGLVCLSVRSAFDSILESQAWPEGSEIIFSGLTIGDMPRIAEEHGYIVKAVDIDLDSLAPSLDAIQAKTTSRTKAIVVAHLMGARCNLDAHIQYSKERGIYFIEDCAQAWTGPGWLGSANADVSLFSFGPIKTQTALGGAIAVLQNEEDVSVLSAHQASLPIQPTVDFFNRLLKYGLIKIASARFVSGMIVKVLRWRGKDQDAVFGALVKSFSAELFFKKIRRRPSAALKRLMWMRLTNL